MSVNDQQPIGSGGFDVQVLVDRKAYAPGEMVRITVSATNHSDRWIEQHVMGWRRFELSVRDQWHRAVATDEETRPADTPMVDRWMPGQMTIWPVYWHQHQGPVVATWSSHPVGPLVEPGRYRVRVRWLAREPDRLASVIEADSAWFDIV